MRKGLHFVLRQRPSQRDVGQDPTARRSAAAWLDGAAQLKIQYVVLSPLRERKESVGTTDSACRRTFAQSRAGSSAAVHC